MKTQKYKILDVKKTPEGVDIDVRINVDAKNCSPEFIEDLVKYRDNMVNGVTGIGTISGVKYNQEYFLRLELLEEYDSILIEMHATDID